MQSRSLHLPVVSLAAVLLGAGGATAEITPRPDLQVDSIGLKQDGELVVTVSNQGTLSMSGLCTDARLSVVVDGRNSADFVVGLDEAGYAVGVLGVGGQATISTGIHLNGRSRHVLTFVDSGRTCMEEDEYQNTHSLSINVFPRSGFDLALDPRIEGGIFRFYVENRGTQTSLAYPSLAFTVTKLTAGGSETYYASLAEIAPGETDVVDPFPAIPAIEGHEYHVRMAYDSADLDNTNNATTIKHIVIDTIDPDVPGTEYYELLNNNPDLRDAIKWYPLCPEEGCRFFYLEDCPPIDYDDWTGDWAFLKDRLTDLLLDLEQGRGLPIDGPPAQFVDEGGGHYIADSQDAVDIYLGHVAQALWFEVHGEALHGIDRSRWSLNLLTPTQLAELDLSSASLFDEGASPDDGICRFKRGERWNPRIFYDVMNHLGMIRPTADGIAAVDGVDGTVWALIDWFRAYVKHGPGGTDDEEVFGWHTELPEKMFYPLKPGPAGHIAYRGCHSSAYFFVVALRPLGIPFDGQGTCIAGPGGGTGCGHSRFELPTIRKPGAQNPGVVIVHGDDFYSWCGLPDKRCGGGMLPFGDSIAPSYEHFYTRDEADLLLGPGSGGNVLDECPALCDIECTCTLEGSHDCNSCAQQRHYAGCRISRLGGKQYLAGEWLYAYYADPDEDPEAAAAYVRPWMRSMNGDGEEYALPILSDQEQDEFLAALDNWRTNFSGEPNPWAAAWAFISDRADKHYERRQTIYWSDCNGNDVSDAEDISGGTSLDCNQNYVPDECDLDSEGSEDCNGNDVPDECDIAGETSEDCNTNDTPDECEIAWDSPAPGGPFFCEEDCDPDCNINGVPDECDIAGETWEDCNADETPDECEIDENSTAPGGPYFCQQDCDPDCNNNGVPDECDTDCNDNSIPDDCDIATGTSEDCDENGVPDECEPDCNDNGVTDACDIRDGTSEDCNLNGVPDECDIAADYLESSPMLSPMCNAILQHYTFVSPPEAFDNVTLSFKAQAYLGMLNGLNKYLTVRINGTSVGTVFAFDGHDCPPIADRDQLVIDAATFNSLVAAGDGDALVSIQGSLFMIECGCEEPDDAYVTVTLRMGSTDWNNNGTPDDCERTNRYLTLAPETTGPALAYQVELTDSAYFPDSTGILGWVGQPDADDVSRVVSDAFFSDEWPPVVHLGDCEIVPAATYDLKPTEDGINFGDPIALSTILEPFPKKWGDTVGELRGIGWSPPNGVVNMDDVNAAIQKFKRLPTAPPWTWVDVDGETPNVVLNFTDIMMIVQGFQGQPYPFSDPADCP